MCIIVSKEVGVENPSEEILKQCWDKNNDGAGLAYYNPDNNDWCIEKGFMTWKAFKKAFYKKNFTKDNTWIAHFRIGTCGNTDKGNTHPFPVVSQLNKMRKLKLNSDMIAFHNGVMGSGEKIYSDSQVAIRDFVYPIMQVIDTSKKFIDILEKVLDPGSCRWLVCNKEDMYYFGTWHEKDGVKYSNTGYIISSYKPVTHNYRKKYTPMIGEWEDIGNNKKVYRPEKNSNYNSSIGGISYNSDILDGYYTYADTYNHSFNWAMFMEDFFREEKKEKPE